MRFQSVICPAAVASASDSLAPAAIASRQTSSNCVASSRTMRASRSGTRSGSESRDRTNAVQSRTGDPHDVVDRVDVGLPGGALAGEDVTPLRGQPVEAAFALTGFLHPSTFDQSAVLEPEQGGVERRQGKGQASARTGLDQLPDLISVARPIFDQRQDQHLGAALLQFRTEHMPPDM